MTRKLRNYARGRIQKINKEELNKIRKKIKNREFKNKMDLKRYIGDLNKK